MFLISWVNTKQSKEESNCWQYQEDYESNGDGSRGKDEKAVEAALNTRTYAQMAWDLLVHLSKTEKTELHLLEIRPVKSC